jgi:hypothetical protein
LSKISFAKLNSAAARTLAFMVWLTAAGMVGGCGMKAPPEPPRGDKPPAVDDLSYSVSDNTITLSWTLPQVTAKAKNAVTGFLIYQYRQSAHERECPNCPVIFEKIGEVPARQSGRSQGGAQPITFVYNIKPGYRYIYKVKAYDKEGTTSRDSNFIEFLF